MKNGGPDINKNSTPSETLYAEAAWLRIAHANSVDKGYPKAYRAGFADVIEWIELHARQARDMERNFHGTD